MAKVWSKRFDNTLNPFIEKFNSSIGFDNKLILIIPLNDEGEIWYENIRFSRNLKYQKLEEEINIFFTFNLYSFILMHFWSKEIFIDKMYKTSI